MLDVIIIGAGFSGLYQLHSLRDKLNLNCHLFEMGDEIGGTWYWNSYPGARCDTESQAYCYYFDKKIYNKWNWTERYPAQSEIQDYLKFVAKELNLNKNISLSSKVIKMNYIEDLNKWKIVLENGKSIESRFVVTAVGCLSKPNTPKINSIENFKGRILHSAKWPKENIDFKGLKVAVFGTGSSGIQIIPEIAKEAEHLTVFQRTANYSLPANNHKLSLKKLKEHKINFDELKNISINNRHGHPWKHSNIPITQDKLKACIQTLEKSWSTGGLSFRDTFSNINYDLCPTVSLQIICEQVIEAVIWIYNNCEIYGADKNCITISGHSAGAHLVSYILNLDWRKYNLPYNLFKGAALVSGIYDLEIVRKLTVNDDVKLNAIDAKNLTTINKLPFYKIPIIISYGEDEPLGWKDQSIKYEKFLKKNNFNIDLILCKKNNHFTLIDTLALEKSTLCKKIINLSNISNE